MSLILTSIIVLLGLGILAALILYFVSTKFKVYEDPRIAEVEVLLPGANCGSCGESGCHAFAVACCKATTMSGLNCPGAGPAAMKRIATIVGLAPVDTTPQVAIVCCNGSCQNRPRTSTYDGVRSCAIENSVYAGDTDCSYGCLGCGDCVQSCPYDAIHIDAATGIPVVDSVKCVGCGRCVTACPREIIELADRNTDNFHIFVACRNKDKGAAAMKVCAVSCIGCKKCEKVCPSESVKVTDFISHINQKSCTRCGACLEACPRKSILKI